MAGTKAKQAVYAPNVLLFRFDNGQAIKPRASRRMGMGWDGGLDWAGLDWSLAEFEVRTVGSNETE